MVEGGVGAGAMDEALEVAGEGSGGLGGKAKGGKGRWKDGWDVLKGTSNEDGGAGAALEGRTRRYTSIFA